MADSQMAQSEIGGLTAGGNHVIELIHGRKSVLMNKPVTIHDAKKEAILCFGAALGRVDIDSIQLSFRPSYLSAVIWDDAAWAILPQAARVRVTVLKEQDVPLVRRVASAGVPVARPPPLRTAAAAPDPVVRQPQLQSRATSSATAARQERRARRGPYRTGTAPTQAETRQLNRIIRSFERSFNAARASDTANARTGAQAASITAGTSAAAAESSRPNSLPVTQPSPASTEDPADYRSSAPSPPSVRNDVDSRNHGSSTSVARLSNIVPAGHPSGTQRQGVNGRPSSVAGATRVPAGGAAPASAARRETQLASSASTVHPSTSSTPGNTGSLSSSFSVPQAVASSSSSAQPRAALQRQVATQDPVPSLVVTPPADAIALYLPAALQPVTTIKLRSGATYLQPRAQEVWTFDNLEPDFRFRYVRERIARMRGTIPGRTTLTYKGVTLQDHWKASEVSMKDGDTIFYFFDQPRVHLRGNSPLISAAPA